MKLGTVGKNIIATTKIRNNYGAIQSFIFQYCYINIGLFSIAPCKVITINPLCILFDSDSCRSFTLLKAIVMITVTFR